MEWVDDILKRIPDSVLNVIGLLSGVITIVNIVPILVRTIRMVLSGTFSFSQLNSLRVSAIFLLLFCIWLLYKTIKYRKVQAETREVFSKGYYNLLRRYRNAMGEIQVAQKKSENSLRIIRDFIQDALDVLCDVLEKLSRQKISGCVKIIVPEKELSYKNASVYTFCRSKSSDPQRDAYDKDSRKKILIRENTDFNIIVEQDAQDLNQSCFYCSDLIAYKKWRKKTGADYYNSNNRWDDFYRSTIVVPIRIANEKNPHNELKDQYTILGFLCVDSKSTHAFEESQKAYYQPIIKAFAALLYPVLDLYRFEIDSKKEQARRNG